MGTVPHDPVMLLSYVNTQLRDHYPTAVELCAALSLDREKIDKTLASIGYEYDADRNQYV